MPRPAILRTQRSGMVLELMPSSICVGRLMVNESRESGDGEFKTSDVLITVLTSAALPVASRILTLSFGDNSLWSVDRLFIIYFASFSGWILRSYFQLVVERSGMRDKSYDRGIWCSQWSWGMTKRDSPFSSFPSSPARMRTSSTSRT